MRNGHIRRQRPAAGETLRVNAKYPSAAKAGRGTNAIRRARRSLQPIPEHPDLPRLLARERLAVRASQQQPTAVRPQAYSKMAKVRTSMLSRGRAAGCVSGSWKLACGVNRARPSARLSQPLISSASAVVIRGAKYQR